MENKGLIMEAVVGLLKHKSGGHREDLVMKLPK